jgi:putative flippase GtrA
MTRFVRYFLVGGIAAAVNLAVFAALVHGAGLLVYAAATISFLIATLVNYLLSVRLVFASGARFPRHREIVLVYLVSAVGLAVNQAVLLVLVAWLRADALIAQATALGSVFLWNYGARNCFVFKPAISEIDGVDARNARR